MVLVFVMDWCCIELLKYRMGRQREGRGGVHEELGEAGYCRAVVVLGRMPGVCAAVKVWF